MSNAVTAAERSATLEQYILHHVQNSHEWTLPFVGRIELPEYLSLHALMLAVTAAIVLLLFAVLYRKRDPVPTGLTNLLEVFVLFIRNQACIPALGERDGRRMTPLFCSFFFFVLVANLIGQIPSFTPPTSNVNVTGALASIVLGIMIFGTIARNGIGGFFGAFIPPGVPWPLLLITFPLELLGIFVKTFALMIRLFANMFAGHIIMFSLLGMVYMFGLLGLPAVFLAVGIMILELGVAFLQAYIFTLLSAMFIGHLYHPAH